MLFLKLIIFCKMNGWLKSSKEMNGWVQWCRNMLG